MGNNRDKFEEYCESVGLSILKSNDKYSSNDTESAWLLWQYKEKEIQRHVNQYTRLFNDYRTLCLKIEAFEKTRSIRETPRHTRNS